MEQRRGRVLSVEAGRFLQRKTEAAAPWNIEADLDFPAAQDPVPDQAPVTPKLSCVPKSKLVRQEKPEESGLTLEVDRRIIFAAVALMISSLIYTGVGYSQPLSFLLLLSVFFLVNLDSASRPARK